MALQLPTDTAATRLATKQYELFGRRVGNGVDRQALALSAAIFLPWVMVLVLLGVPFVSRLGPQMYIVPPFFTLWRATRTDESGRIALMRLYDRLLAFTPQRQAVLRNPLLYTASTTPRGPETVQVITILRPKWAV